jgi:hypothetical protein
MNGDFRELFCTRFKCSDEEYEEKLFWKCVYRHALPLVAVLFRSKPARFREDFDLIREVGHAKCRAEVIGELNRFYGRNVRDRSWLRKLLLIRISGKRLLKIQRQVFAQAESAEVRNG